MDVGGVDEASRRPADLLGDDDVPWLRSARHRGGLASINTESLPRRVLSAVLANMREDRLILPEPTKGQ
ncbi:hypothetical protein [Mycobacterium sp.]|uniref:hypothetical protein n=1 Tax=Mycobacterium sp. TaxID=1785 RepID=UPI003D0EEEE0